MPAVSAGPTFRAALVSTMKTLAGNSVLVTRGNPVFDPYDDCIAVGAVRSTSVFATMSTLRAREETLTCEVTFYSYRAGDETQESVVEARAYELLGLLETFVRVTDTSLGGAVRQCFLTDHEGDSATDKALLAKGRMYVLVATFTAQARITS